MDDNKTLTLMTGERIPASNNLTIIFATPTITHLTMATISRCGVIRLEEEDVRNESGEIHHDVLSQDQNHPFIIVGPSGSGKTVLLKRMMEGEGVKAWILTITPSMTANDVLDQLFKLCLMKRSPSGYILEPIFNRLCLCFKHLDLASDSVHELLRLLITRQSLWHTFKRNGRLGNQQFKLAENISIFATAYDTRFLPNDLIKHFSVVQIGTLSIQDLESMCLPILHDVIDISMINKVIGTFKKIQQVFEDDDIPVNLRDLMRWVMAIKENPEMVTILAHSLFTLRSNSIHIENAVSNILQEEFGAFNYTPSFTDSSLVTTYDFIRIVSAISTVLRCPSHIIIYGPKGSGRRTSILAALRHHNISSIIMNAHEFEDKRKLHWNWQRMGNLFALSLILLSQ